jgi:hypothetical protein
MVDIDHGAIDLIQEILTENLHVTSKHNQSYALFAYEIELSGFRLGFVFLRAGNMQKRQPVLLRGMIKVGMIGHDADYFAAKLLGFPTKNQVVKTVVGLRHEKDDGRAFVRESSTNLHPELFFGHFGEEIRFRIEVFAFCCMPLDTLKKYVHLTIEVLVRMEHVAAPVMYPSGNFSHYPGTIGTMQKRYDGYHGKTNC